LSDALAAIGISGTARAEEINVGQFLGLAEFAKAQR